MRNAIVDRKKRADVFGTYMRGIFFPGTDPPAPLIHQFYPGGKYIHFRMLGQI
jgi:hypothetical protein